MTSGETPSGLVIRSFQPESKEKSLELGPTYPCIFTFASLKTAVTALESYLHNYLGYNYLASLNALKLRGLYRLSIVPRF